MAPAANNARRVHFDLPLSPASTISSSGPRTPSTGPSYARHIIPLPAVSPDFPSINLPVYPPSPIFVPIYQPFYPLVPAPAPVPSQASLRPQVQVNLKLAAPGPGERALVDWDLWMRPSKASERRAGGAQAAAQRYAGLSSALLAEPATTPGVAQLTLSVAHPNFQWTIPVNARGEHVTVDDVLIALYDALQLPVRTAEWREAERARIDKAIAKSFRDRCRQVPGNMTPQAAEQLGVKRIDYLTTSRLFAGLEVANSECGAKYGEVDGVELRLQLRDV
ncbi:uncharacterized protein FIBRA_08084 [Fibroporia radiculosa]|uniref:DUF6699 domain-containing protein n=1 Tax=Fibroporia radiculosa TaxID=599839 RepID=J4GGE4_9APHY|nr:uncharacterized protein FIBRA_08084 [Fibroporia radiculosa]CCM05848.1 predicted protein [Fibroporia radiculosa]